jgi:hypothetical protein
MTLLRRAVIVAALAAVSTARTSAAAVERFAILIGNNAGESDDVTLRFAETDAARLRDVFAEVGGVPAENLVLLQGGDANAARRAIITVNDRIRTLPAANEAELVVYYSGHADATALHMGGTRFDVDELQRLVRGSPAAVRVLVVDACRSGSITRVKGGRHVEPFAIDLDDRLASQGAIFLTSSAANEDAQESDELGGSFFTHYLVSGLLGAADTNADGRVSLAEAYRYAYDNTLRATSRTLAGIQHPTFEYDLSGRGDVVLAMLGSASRGWLQFPEQRAYLVLRGDRDGPVVAEVGSRDRRRRLSLRPGRYFVRGRGADFLTEGVVDVVAGNERVVHDDELERIAYARLVRKGGALPNTRELEVGALARSAIANAATACLGSFAGFQIEYPSFGLGGRLEWCRASSQNTSLSAKVDQLAFSIRLGKLWDIGRFAVGPSLTVGGGAFDQRFDTTGIAPARLTAFGHVAAEVNADADLARRAYATVALGTDTYAFRQDSDGGHVAMSSAVRFTLALGLRL